MKFSTITSQLALLIALCGFFGSTAFAAKEISGVVNINTASVDELMLLPDIGRVKAEKIVSYRKANPFSKIDDIVNVKGIGPKTFRKIAKYLATSGATTAKD